MKNLLLLVGLFFSLDLTGQTVLTGKVKGVETKEDLIGATVKVLKGNELIRVGDTDFDGVYRFDLEAGTYDVEAISEGYKTSKTTHVPVLEGRQNFFNVEMESGTLISEVKIVTMTIRIIQTDQTWTGQTFDSYQLKNWFR